MPITSETTSRTALHTRASQAVRPLASYQSAQVHLAVRKRVAAKVFNEAQTRLEGIPSILLRPRAFRFRALPRATR